MLKIAYTLVPKYLYRDYFQANVVHGPLVKKGSRSDFVTFLDSRVSG